MEATEDTDEAIDRLVLTGVLQADEAMRLRARAAEGAGQRSSPATASGSGSSWRMVDRDAVWSPAVERPTGPALERWDTTPSATGAEPYEPFAGAALRIWQMLQDARRSIRSPRFLSRLAVVVATLLVVLFWILVAVVLMGPIPPVVRPFVLLLFAAGLAYAGHRHGGASTDAWSLLAYASALGAGLGALHATPWTFPYPWAVAPALVGLTLFVASRSRHALGVFLPASPVVVIPWAAVVVAQRTSVPLTPVYVVLSLGLVLVATVAALPALQRPARRRYGWWPLEWEPMVIACAVALVWSLPRALEGLQAGTAFPAASILLVLMTLFLYGLRVRSLAAVTVALAAPLLLLVYGLLVVLGPLGWLAVGFALGALLVWSRLRRRTPRTGGVSAAEGVRSSDGGAP